MKPNDLRAKSESELRKALEKTRKKLFDLRMELSAGQEANTSQVGKFRKDIARIKTVLREKEILKNAEKEA